MTGVEVSSAMETEIEMTTLLEIDQLNISVGIGGLAHSLFVPRMKLKLGQTIILMGPSGSGKSVFMKALSGVF